MSLKERRAKKWYRTSLEARDRLAFGSTGAGGNDRVRVQQREEKDMWGCTEVILLQHEGALGRRRRLGATGQAGTAWTRPWCTVHRSVASGRLRTPAMGWIGWIVRIRVQKELRCMRVWLGMVLAKSKMAGLAVRGNGSGVGEPD